MKGYVLSIAGVVLISALITLLLPQGKISSTVRIGCKLFCLLVLISPFFSVFQGKSFEFSTIDTDSGYLAYCVSLAEKEEESKFILQLQEKYGISAQVDVDCMAQSPFSVKKISVYVLDFGINKNEEHINIMKKIQGDYEKAYGCEVRVYE